MVSSTSSDIHSEEGGCLRQRVRGITKGKSTTRLVKHSEEKLSVTVDEEFKALVGANSTKVANLLGIYIRKKAPVEDVSKWSDIDLTIRDSIIQGMLGSFVIEGYGTKEIVTKVVNAKCKDLYKNWRCRARNYYKRLLAKGKDPNVHCFPTMESSKWKYMIEKVWSSESFMKRSEINTQNRAKMSYVHTMGSKSFASALCDISDKAKGKEEQTKFSEFFKLSHSNKDGDWIDGRCEEDYAALQQLENDAEKEPISPKELSQKVFGKKYYLTGLGTSMKASSKIRSIGASNNHDLQALTTEIETLKNASQEYDERLIAQEATIKSQKAEIEPLKKNNEEMANRQMRLLNVFVAGGTLSDESLNIN